MAKQAVETKRVRYTQGILKGNEATLAAAIADDVVSRGFAEFVEREHGEEG